MEKEEREDNNQTCSECIYKNNHDANEKKIVESLKQLEGIKKTLLSLIK
jgi:hypothetical protein